MEWKNNKWLYCWLLERIIVFEHNIKYLNHIILNIFVGYKCSVKMFNKSLYIITSDTPVKIDPLYNLKSTSLKNQVLGITFVLVWT